MFRATLAALGILAAATPACAIDFDSNDAGSIDFTMPSGNIGCVYTPAGGTGTYMPQGGGPELSCDRVEPAYVRVILGPAGKAKRDNAVGDASCCGQDNSFGYGEARRVLLRVLRTGPLVHARAPWLCDEPQDHQELVTRQRPVPARTRHAWS